MSISNGYFYSRVRDFIRVIRSAFNRKVRYRLNNVDPSFLCVGSSYISRDLIAGKFSYIGPGCSVCAGVSLGKFVMLGPGVRILGADHVFDLVGVPIIFSGRPPGLRTDIGDDVWIGANSLRTYAKETFRVYRISSGSGKV